MIIITDLFLAVKNLAFVYEFLQILFSDAIERHDRVFPPCIISIQCKPHNNIQIGVRQALYHENRSVMLTVNKNGIRLECRSGSIFLEQLHIFRVTFSNMLQTLVHNNQLICLQLSKALFQILGFQFSQRPINRLLILHSRVPILRYLRFYYSRFCRFCNWFGRLLLQ